MAPDAQQITILVVDDELVIHKVIEKGLQKNDYQLLFSETAQQAVEVARHSESIEIALVDKNLPDKCGLEIIEELQALHPDLEVLLITGYPSMESAIEAIQVGAFDYIEKPLDHINTLQLRINNALESVHLKRTQRLLLAELQKSNQRYELAAESSHNGIWDWDLQKNTMYFSPQWKAMLGYALTRCDDHYVDPLGSSPNEWFERVHEKDLPKLLHAIYSHIKGKSPHIDTEYRMLHIDGQYRWMLCRGLVVHNSEGNATRVVGTQTDITLRKTVEEGLLRDALRDGLTGLAHKALLEERLTRLCESKPPDPHYALLLLDVDGFSELNDRLGYPIGNELLISFGQRLQQVERSSNMLARTGPDQFAILLERISGRDEVQAVLTDIQRQLAPPFQLNSHALNVTASIGVALGHGAGDTAEKIINRALLALHKAQSSGVGAYEFYTDSIWQAVIGSRSISADLKHAIAHHQLRVQYQPIYELDNKKIVGFEALVRWQHPQRGLLLPGAFLQAARDNGQMLPLSNWMLLQVCHLAKKWQSRFADLPSPFITLNLCNEQLSQGDLSEQIERTLREFELTPAALKLEITENAITSNIERAIATLARLQSMGISLCIDDFGTGHSSLLHLSRLPIDIIKIDQSFVQRMNTFEKDRHLVESILLLANKIGMQVIAEGVETHAQAAQLQRMHCRFVQGFLYSRALNEHDAEALLLTQSASATDHELPSGGIG